MKDITVRFLIVYEYLFSIKKVNSYNDFAKKIGISSSLINEISKKRTNAGLIPIQNTVNKFTEINSEWLLTGKGEMLRNENKNLNESISIPDRNKLLIPLVGKYSYTEYITGFNNPEYIKTLPTIPIIADRELNGKYLGFEMYGNSMENSTDRSIIEGDILISAEINDIFWKYELPFDKWYFVIVHKNEGILIKKIIKHDVNKGIITLHSLNPLYKDIELSMKNVVQLFSVLQIVRKMKI
ncbi:LexA family protein [Apibacter adventoris]|uniref:LexA family protein n=1 Tax=Apibacter adventoris TaxID=1679466 RepID=UPI000CF6AED3|nr:helix-turn-helix transcriptional regulator [Apibacter adventoris]PQL95184.1 hypothetical protein C4S76_03085 [Apibacter adventoris]